MKTAIYIKEGRTQLVLTPETDFERGVVSSVDKGEHDVKVYLGAFYDCQGGWSRQRAPLSARDDESLIVVMDIK